LGSDKSKLSKRHGAVSLSEYKELGYLPEAMINFMVFLGWNPGSEREIYSISSLVKDFSIEKIQKSGAMFNIKKLDFINSFYIKQKNIESLTELCIPYMIKDRLIYQSNENFKEYKRKEDDKDVSLEEIQRIVLIHQDRIKKLSEISELTEYFFKKIEYDEDLLIWKNSTKNKTIKNLDNIENILHKIDIESWNKENIELTVMTEAEKTGDRGSILWPLRVALTGKKASAGPIEVAEILGKEETIKRIKNAKNL
jgi:nondiscriminating glutamyl-tRNA synthetase